MLTRGSPAVPPPAQGVPDTPQNPVSADAPTAHRQPELPDVADDAYQDRMVIAPVAGQTGQTKVINVTMALLPATAKVSSNAWQNAPLPAQFGTFTVAFDATPAAENINAVTALSSASISTYANGAILVRFNSQGFIDASNGGTFAAADTIPYAAGRTCRFRLVVSVPAHTYSAFVTPIGGPEQTLADNYPFSAQQATIASLANWGLFAEAGSHTVSNFHLAGTALAAEAGVNVTVPAGGTARLVGSASGGTAPYKYSWSPGTGLSSATAAAPTAAPAATTTYTLTVQDAVGRAASDSVTVTVGGGVSGTTYYVSPTGHDSNSGTLASPWRTLSKAAASATAGTTVIVRPGTYCETLAPANNGSLGSWITFKSETPRGAIIDGEGTRSSGIDLSRPNRYVRVEGFEVRNHAGDGVFFTDWYTQGTQGLQVVGCYIHDNAGDAVNCRNTRDALVEGNELCNNGLTAVAGGGRYGSTNLVIRANRIYHNVKDGVQGIFYNLVAEYNVMYDQFHTDAHQDAFDIDLLDGGVIRYNTLSDFTQLVYSATGADASCYWRNVKIYGNVFYNHRYWTVGGVDGPGGCPAVNIGTGLPGNYVRDIEIFNNTFGYLGDGQKAIMIYGIAGTTMDNIRIYNNIFYNCRGGPGDAIDWSSNATNILCDYNCYYVVRPRPGYDAHSIQADPRFANYSPFIAWDFRLQAASPCINKGDPNLGSHVAVPSPFVDIDGRNRPKGTIIDIGAYEAQ